MKVFAIACLVTMLTACPFQASAFGFDPNIVLVKLTTGAIESTADTDWVLTASTETVLSECGIHSWRPVFPNAEPREGVPDLRLWIRAEIDPSETVDTAITALITRDEIQRAERRIHLEKHGVPNDPSYASQQYHWPLIHAEAAWDISHGDPAVTVAIIDSGADLDHEDLAAAFWHNTEETIDGIDNDGNGYIDDYYGWDFNGSDSNPDCVNLDNIHGTHVAGIVGAVTNNAIGCAGGTWGCSLMTCKVFPDGEGGAYPDDVAEAIAYAADNGARIINMSLGGGAASVEEDAIEYAHGLGLTVFASSGNGGNDGIGDTTPSYPAAYDGVIAVGSTNKFDNKDSSSNYGNAWVDVFACGVSIYSTEPGNTYKKESGTSMASPVAAALGALLASAYPGITRDQIEQRIEGGCVNIDPYNPAFMGNLSAGRIDFLNSMTNGPVIRIERLIVRDGSGNNNYEADAGETVQLDLYLKNHSWTGGSGISVTLSTTSSAVQLVDSTASFGDFASKQIKGPADPLMVTISASAASVVDITVTISGSGGYSSEQTLEVSINNRFPEFPSFPVHSQGGFNSSPKLADMNGDSDLEIIAASNDGLIHVIGPDGMELPGWPVFISTIQPFDSLLVLGAPAIADLNLDASPDVIIVDYWTDTEYRNPGNPNLGTKSRINGRLHAFSAAGTYLTGFPVQLTTSFYNDPAEAEANTTGFKCAPVVADILGDSHPEIIAGNYNNRMFVFGHDGQVIPGWPKDLGTDIFTTAAIADLDQDGTQEIVVATKDDVEPLDYGDLYVFAPDGSVKTGFPVRIPNQIYSAPVVLDIDGDSDLEIVFGYGDYNAEITQRGLNALHHTGEPVAGFPVGTISTVYGSPAIGDLDGDTIPEFVVGDFSGRVYAFHTDGTPVTGWPVVVTGDKISSCPVIADIDGSGNPEVIVSSGDLEGYLHILNSDGTEYASAIALDADGFPSPAVGDIDGDGDIEIVACSRTIHCYNLTGPYDHEKQYWTSYHGDNANTGFYHRTPLSTGVILSLSASDFVAGMPFDLNAIMVNGTSVPQQNIDLFVILDVYGSYFFYPTFTPDVVWQDFQTLAQGITTIDVLTFDWPDGNFGSAENLLFWGAMLDASSALFGEYDVISFGYH